MTSEFSGGDTKESRKPPVVVKETCFHTSEDFYKDIVVAIGDAVQSVDINIYILRHDSTGNRIFNAVLAAAKSGVAVRVLVDGFGSYDWVAAQSERETPPNMLFRVYHPVPFLSSRRFMYHHTSSPEILTMINRRDHKKLTIIDGVEFYVGSANFCNESANQRETVVRTNDPVLEAQAYFDFTWERSHKIEKIGKLPIRFKSPKFRKFPSSRLRCNFNLASRKNNNRRFVQSIRKAKSRIWIMNPYFIPHKRLLSAIAKAAKRGVDVKILLPDEIDIRTMKIAARYYYPYLIKKNVKIFEYEKGVLHSKISIVDDAVLVGSSNLDHRSLFTNLEVDLFLQTPEAKNEICEMFRCDLLNSREITPAELKKTHLVLRLLAPFFLWFRRWL